MPGPVKRKCPGFSLEEWERLYPEAAEEFHQRRQEHLEREKQAAQRRPEEEDELTEEELLLELAEPSLSDLRTELLEEAALRFPLVPPQRTQGGNQTPGVERKADDDSARAQSASPSEGRTQ